MTLLIFLTLATVTKPTTFFLLPTLATALFLWLAGRLRWSAPLIYGLLGLVVGLTLIGSLFLHQYSEGGRRLLSLLETTFNPLSWDELVTEQPVSFYVSALNFAVLSFGGLFGWSNIHIPWLWVRVWAGILFFIGAGGLIFCYKAILKTRPPWPGYTLPQRDILIVLLLALIFSFIGIFAAIVGSESSSWSFHSRYYFPAVIPLALFLYLGFWQLFPANWRNLALPLWLTGWILYDGAVLFVIILPYLYS